MIDGFSAHGSVKNEWFQIYKKMCDLCGATLTSVVAAAAVIILTCIRGFQKLNQAMQKKKEAKTGGCAVYD